jgi:hypothetical protein
LAVLAVEASGDTVDRMRWSDSSEWACVQRIAVRPFPVLGDFKGERPIAGYMKVFVDALKLPLQARGVTDVVLADVDSGDADVVIEGEFLDLTNGSRAARFWVGFGAGKSKCHVRLTGKSRDGSRVLFTAEHERISAAGLSKDELAEDVTEVARDIGQALARNRGTCDPAKVPTPVGTIQAETAQGLVSIESTPDNAEVYLDGELIGMTPLPHYRMNAGTRVVEVSKKGFVPWRRDLKVGAGADTRIGAELEPTSDAPPAPSAESSPPPRE